MHTMRLMLYLICISLLAVGVCGVVPTEDMLITSDTTLDSGIYYLDDTEGDGAIKIGASNIVLDCNGAVIIGTGSGQGIVGNGVLDMQWLMETTDNLNNPAALLEGNNLDLLIGSTTFVENVVIKNCNISHYENGTNLIAFKNLELSNNDLSNNTNGAYIFLGYESKVDNNRVYNNTNGIYSVSLNTSLSNNTAYNNTGIGIINAGISSNSSGNNVYGNGLGIASVGFYNKVFNNDVSNNGRSGNIKGGILAFGGNGTEVFNNTASWNNQSGIGMINIADVKVYNNIAEGNEVGISLGGFLQGGESYSINISNNTANYNSKAGILFDDRTMESVLRMTMTGDAAGAGHVIRDSHITDNNLDNTGEAYDLYMNDVNGMHITDNVIKGNNFNGHGIHDGYSGNNDYCDGNHYGASASVPDAFGIRGITMSVSQEGSFLSGTIDVCDLDMDGDVTCGFYSHGGLGELVVNPDCTITSNQTIDYFWRNGTYNIRVWAKDPEFGEKMIDVNITVANTNRAPDITDVDIYALPQPPTYPEEEKRLYGDVYGSDPDGGSVECQIISSTMPNLIMQPNVCSFCYCPQEPCWTSCGDNCWSCTGSAPLSPAPEVNYTITVNMTDGFLNTTFSKDFEVQRAPTKPNTSTDGIGVPCILNGVQTKVYVGNSTDPNGDSFVYNYTSSLPMVNSLFSYYDEDEWKFSWDPTCDQKGVYLIWFYAEDSFGLRSPEQMVTFIVS